VLPRRSRGVNVGRSLPRILRCALRAGWAITWVSRRFASLTLDAPQTSLYSLANQEVLRWQLAMQKELGDNITHENIKDYLWKTLKSGQVVPGLVTDFLFVEVLYTMKHP
jgi:hypothetical protein